MTGLTRPSDRVMSPANRGHPLRASRSDCEVAMIEVEQSIQVIEKKKKKIGG